MYVDCKCTDMLILILAADAQSGFGTCRIEANRIDVADMMLFHRAGMNVKQTGKPFLGTAPHM